MAVDPSTASMGISTVWPSIITGGAGLLGVIVGSAVTWIRESRKEKSTSKKELVLLGILVSA